MHSIVRYGTRDIDEILYATLLKYTSCREWNTTWLTYSVWPTLEMNILRATAFYYFCFGRRICRSPKRWCLVECVWAEKLSILCVRFSSIFSSSMRHRTSLGEKVNKSHFKKFEKKNKHSKTAATLSSVVVQRPADIIESACVCIFLQRTFFCQTNWPNILRCK